MSGFSSLSIAVSGMSAAQYGLSVVGHNLANVGTAGYTRQQVIQQDFRYTTLGVNATGKLQTGLGADIAQIRQIRNQFLDVSYRSEASKSEYYQVKAETGERIESLLGELESDYKTQTVIQDFWDALNELNSDPTSIDTRGIFVNTAVTLVDKFDNIYKGLVDYQMNLNDQIKQSVKDINDLTYQINDLTKKIKSAEATGDNANDFRDSRNLALDNLSQILNVNYVEKADGTIDIFCEGKALLSNGVVNKLGLKYVNGNSSLVEPVFTNKTGILPPDSKEQPLYTLTGKINPEKGQDKGGLKGMLISRGSSTANYASYDALVPPDPTDTTKYPAGINDDKYKEDKIKYEEELFNLSQCTIPKTMMELDTLFNSIVTLINDALAPQVQSPDDPTGIDVDKSQHLEMFVRNTTDRYDAAGNYIAEDPFDVTTLYTLGNVHINPEFLDPGGYDKIPLSNSGDINDVTLITSMLEQWSKPSVVLPTPPGTAGFKEPLSIEGAYNQIVVNVATYTGEAAGFVDQQNVLLNKLNSDRQQISGVSLDEEMQNVMKYQFAYEASARVVNVIDSMLDKLINGTGRVGL